jgi:hypothetical protein
MGNLCFQGIHCDQHFQGVCDEMKNYLLYRSQSGRNTEGVHFANKWAHDPIHRCCIGREADGTVNGASQLEGTSLPPTT